MDNASSIVGAKKVLGAAMNQIYTNLVQMLKKIGMFGVATDKNIWMFAGSNATPFKCVTDSSGSSGLPENGILIADSNGHANASQNMTMTENVLQLPSEYTIAFGDQTVDGAKRILVSSSGISFEERINGEFTPYIETI